MPAARLPRMDQKQLREALDRIAGSHLPAHQLPSDELNEALRKIGSGMMPALPDDVIRGWRNSLAHANAQILQTVSGSMAEQIAGIKTIGLPEFFLRDTDQTLRRIGEQLTPRVAYNLTAELHRFIQPAAFAAARDFAARIEPQATQWRRSQTALLEMGWLLPGSLPVSFFRTVGSSAMRGERVAVRRQLVATGRQIAPRLLEEWMELDVFRERRRFLRDGVSDLQAGRYRVSIPMLLPQLEGIAIDAFAPGSTLKSPVPALTSTGLTVVAGDAMVETVTVLWAYQDFSAIAAGSRRLNRHLVLHGRSTGYGTGENAVKVLFALDQLASMVRRAEGASVP